MSEPISSVAETAPVTPFASTVLRDARRIVVKVGSSLVTNEGRGLDEIAIGEWCRQLAVLMRDGREVVMVSSGAIAEGMKRLGWSTRPREINELQAAAACSSWISRGRVTQPSRFMPSAMAPLDTITTSRPP